MQRTHAIAPRSGGAARRREAGYQNAFALLIVGLLFLGFLLLMVFGAGGYRAAVQGQEQNASLRGQLAYLSSLVRGGDAAGQIAVTQGKYGPMLEITEEGYALRIYHWEGQLWEEYSPKTREPAVENADSLGETGQFSIQEQQGRLTVCTDEGQLVLRLRSGGA